jgi:hypothetical protein
MSIKKGAFGVGPFFNVSRIDLLLTEAFYQPTNFSLELNAVKTFLWIIFSLTLMQIYITKLVIQNQNPVIIISR